MNEIIKLEALKYAPTFTKKDAIATGQKIVNDLFEAGEVDELLIFSNIVRFKEVANAADKSFRDKVSLTQSQSVNGVEFTPKNGAKRLQYSEDPIYLELVAKVKAREELLKVAQNSEIYDDEGVQVPKVSVLFDKESITVKF